MGIGDGELGIGDWGLRPITNPQSPIPNPQSPFFSLFILLFEKKFMQIILFTNYFLKIKTLNLIFFDFLLNTNQKHIF